MPPERPPFIGLTSVYGRRWLLGYSVAWAWALTCCGDGGASAGRLAISGAVMSGDRGPAPGGPVTVSGGWPTEVGREAVRDWAIEAGEVASMDLASGAPATVDMWRRRTLPLEILPGSALEIPAIGTGFDASAEKYMGRCISGTVSRLPAADAAATLKVTSMLDGDKAQQQLGFQIGAKAHFGIGRGSLQAQAAAAMTRDAFSSVWVLAVSFVSEAVELDFTESIVPSLVGEAAIAAHAWYRECGDEFIYQVQKGAQLFVVYRLDYKSENLKEEIEADAAGKRTIVEVNSHLQSIADTLRRHASLTLEVYQFGGDPTRLGAVVSGLGAGLTQAKAAAKAVIQCSTENLAACDALLTQALTYATSLSSEDAFAQQVRHAANPTLYVTAPWSRLGHLPMRLPTDPEVQKARLTLAMAFDRTLAAKKRVDLLVSSDWVDAEQLDELAPWQRTLAYQQGHILGTVATCYDDLRLDDEQPGRFASAERDRCLQAVAALGAGLELPPPTLLRGAVERAISAVWQRELGGRGPDPARRTQAVGVANCGFVGELAVCGYRGPRGATASILPSPIFDVWAHLPDAIRERHARLPAGRVRHLGDHLMATFAPDGAIFVAGGMPRAVGPAGRTQEAAMDGSDATAGAADLLDTGDVYDDDVGQAETDVDDADEEGIFLGGPLWRCWRAQRQKLGAPERAWGEDPGELDTAAIFADGTGLYADAPQICIRVPAVALTAWQRHGGDGSCLKRPRRQQPARPEDARHIACFEGGHVEIDLQTGLGVAHCPWFRHVACR